MGACSATEGSPQLDCEFPTEVSYFGLKTPVFLPTLILLELGDADYKGHSIDTEDWPAMKKTTPGGLLPFAKFNDGEVLTESGAIGRVVAGAAGLLYSGADYAKSERLVGMTADMNKTVAGFIPTLSNSGLQSGYNWDEAKKVWNGTAAIDGKKDACIAEVDRFATFLQGDKKDRFTDKGDSFGEVDLFAKLNCYATSIFPEAATGTLKAFYDRFMDMEAVKKVLKGDSKFGKLNLYMKYADWRTDEECEEARLKKLEEEEAEAKARCAAEAAAAEAEAEKKPEAK